MLLIPGSRDSATAKPAPDGVRARCSNGMTSYHHENSPSSGIDIIDPHLSPSWRAGHGGAKKFLFPNNYLTMNRLIIGRCWSYGHVGEVLKHRADLRRHLIHRAINLPLAVDVHDD